MREYLIVLSTGFVALLAGGEPRDGEFFRGGDSLERGDRDCGRESEPPTDVPGLVGGPGEITPGRSVGLPPGLPAEVDELVWADMDAAPCSCLPSPSIWRPCSGFPDCPGCPSGDGSESSASGSDDAIPVPGLRIGNSSSAFIDALADPGFRNGNSSSSRVIGIGIGLEMVPRIDLRPALARPAVEPDFPNLLGMLIGADYRSAGCGELAGREKEKVGRRWTEVAGNFAVHTEPSDHEQKKRNLRRSDAES